MPNWWLIWSVEHNGWWRANRLGYTTDLDLAGFYTTDDALEILSDANRYGVIQEMMVPVPGFLQE